MNYEFSKNILSYFDGLCAALHCTALSESVCVYSLSVSLFVCVSSIKELENIAELHNTKKLETNRTFIAT